MKRLGKASHDFGVQDHQFADESQLDLLTVSGRRRHNHCIEPAGKGGREHLFLQPNIADVSTPFSTAVKLTSLLPQNIEAAQISGRRMRRSQDAI